MKVQASNGCTESNCPGRQACPGHPSCSFRDAASSALPHSSHHSRRRASWHVIALGVAVLLAAALPQSWASRQDGQGHSRVHRRPRKDQSMGRTLADHSSSLPPGFYKRSVDVRVLPPCIPGSHTLITTATSL